MKLANAAHPELMTIRPMDSWCLARLSPVQSPADKRLASSRFGCAEKSCTDPASVDVIADQANVIAVFCASCYRLRPIGGKGECDDLPAGVY
ncbi:MAG: hypothetical protein P8N94_05870 [Gammaproteobacteria bacterium]|nr:hypothetical protein [Gammaproteobacteria bacterium]